MNKFFLMSFGEQIMICIFFLISIVYGHFLDYHSNNKHKKCKHVGILKYGCTDCNYIEACATVYYDDDPSFYLNV